MIDIETEYFSLNKILLLAIGLWPYKQSNFTQIQFVFLSSILMTNVIFQMRNLLEDLLHIYNEVKDENEIAIINEYGRNGKRFTVALIILALCSIFLIVVSFWSVIFNVILLTNASKTYHMMILTEYFIIDQEKYFYIIPFHFIASAWIGTVVILGVGTTFIVYFELTLGMFRIASYRIERAMSIDMLQNINHKSFLTFKDLIRAVEIHRQAMTLFQYFISRFETMMFCLVIVGIGSFSLNLFQIFQITSSKANIKELICPFLYATITLLYMFLANYYGEIITNLNHNVFVTAYNVRWYVAPLYIQRMILFMLQKNSKSFTLKVGGLFVASIECFSMMIKTSVSYFTVIYSTQ